jgi:hypothetical protein
MCLACIDRGNPYSHGAVFLSSSGTLRGGRQGSRIVSHMELESMIEEMQREDILQVYVFKQGPRVFTAGRASCTRSRTSDVLFLFF